MSSQVSLACFVGEHSAKFARVLDLRQERLGVLDLLESSDPTYQLRDDVSFGHRQPHELVNAHLCRGRAGAQPVEIAALPHHALRPIERASKDRSEVMIEWVRRRTARSEHPYRAATA